LTVLLFSKTIAERDSIKTKNASERLTRLLKMAYREENLSVLSLTEYQLKENKISANRLVFHPSPYQLAVLLRFLSTYS